MKLPKISSILILSHTIGVVFGSSIRGSELGGDGVQVQTNINLEVENLFADNSKNGDGSNYGQVQPKRDVALTMTSSRTEYAANETVAIDITLKNNDTTKPARILNWINPCKNGDGDAPLTLSPVDMSFFDVTTTIGGKSALYLGALIKRKEPTEKDYTTLKAGEQVSCTINLDKYFQFTSPSSDDEYKISYAVTSMQLSNPFKTQGTNAIESLEVETTVLSLKVKARTNLTRFLRDQNTRGLQTGGTTFQTCTTAQRSSLLEARKQALTESTDAVSILTSISQWGNTANCNRYDKWFGPYDPNLLAELKPGFEAISARLNDATISFDCACKTSGVYAYVYPYIPYRIYLCKSFWSAPMNAGSNSKMGTIIHEMSHFTTTAGTTDYAYGKSACRSLADSNPQNAVNNADSHEYFAENYPKLSCSLS